MRILSISAQLVFWPVFFFPAIAGEPTVQQNYRVAGGAATIRIVGNFTQPQSGGVPAHLQNFAGDYGIDFGSIANVQAVNDVLDRFLPGSLFLTQAGGHDTAAFEIVFGGTGALDAEIFVFDPIRGVRVANLGGADLLFDAPSETLQIAAPLLVPQDGPALPVTLGHIRIAANLKLESVAYSPSDHGSSPIPLDLDENGTPRGFPNPGPDLVTGDITHMHQYGRENDRISFAAGTTACNKGSARVNWFAFPSVDHPVMTVNMFRLKDDRFEQLGYSWVKHGFGAAQNNACDYGCTPGCPFGQLCQGCSDPYSANQIAEQFSVTGRNWINPFTGAFANNINNHSGHVHDSNTHRLTVWESDIAQDQSNNATGRYFSEGIYIAPHEYLPNNGVANNQHNNASHRELLVVGDTGDLYGLYPTTTDAIRESPALDEWTGATQVTIEPAPGVDGRALLAYKVTGPINGLYHYEYALYNRTLDRAIRLFRVPVGAGAQVSNIGFYAPTHEAGSANDGTSGGGGISNAPWSNTVGGGTVEWSAETLAQNPNANALRWGTLYNVRFDSDRPPQAVSATVGYFKTGGNTTVATVGPQAAPPCTGDTNGDRVIDLVDLTTLLANFGTASGATPAMGDMDADGDVDLADLTDLLSRFGVPCP